MSIAFGAVSSSYGSNVYSLTYPHTIGDGRQRILIIGVEAMGSWAECDEIRYNGQVLTKAISKRLQYTGNAQVSVAIWYLLDEHLPAAGTYNIAIDMARAVPRLASGAISLSGAKQGVPEALNSNVVNLDVSIETNIVVLTYNAWLIDALSLAGTPAPAFVESEPGSVERYNVDNATLRGVGYTTIATPGTKSMIYEWDEPARAAYAVIALAQGFFDETLQSNVTLESTIGTEKKIFSQRPESDITLESSIVEQKIFIQHLKSDIILESTLGMEQFSLAPNRLWSTHNCTPDINKSYPVSLVEISGFLSNLPPNQPFNGFYKNVLRAHPIANEEQTESLFGLRTKGSMELQIYNKDRFLNADRHTEVVWRSIEPEGTRVFVETNLSLNEGTVWQGWKSVKKSGDPIPGIDGNTDLSAARLQIRETLVTEQEGVTPALVSVDARAVIEPATDLRDLSVRVWRRRNGVNQKIYQGSIRGHGIGAEPSVRLQDLIQRVFFEDIPYRTVTTALFPKAVDVGARIFIATGRVPRLGPLPYVEHDDVNRIYRYVCGEGRGYNNGSWSEVTRGYEEQIAFKQVTGIVQGGSSTTVILDSADERPTSFYKWQWVTIGSQTPRFCTDYDGTLNQITVDSAFDSAPVAVIDSYVVRPWRFYDGSQATPYPGLAILEFKSARIRNGNFAPIYIDADALQEERNFIRFIQSLLSNQVWGKGLIVDQDEFNTEAALSSITAMKCEGALMEGKQLIDILSELLKVRGIRLRNTDKGIGIKVDVAKTSMATYGMGDGKYENISKGTLSDVDLANIDELAKTLTAHYRFDYRAETFLQTDLTRAANDRGVDQPPLELRFVYSHDTADRIVDYLRKREKAKDRSLSFGGRKEAILQEGDRIYVVVPRDGIMSNWEIADLETQNELYAFNLFRYLEETYTYEPSASLPADENIAIPPDFSDTPPDPIANFTVTYEVQTSEDGNSRTYANFAWNSPEENYFETRILFRQNGTTIWNELIRGQETALAEIVPGFAYDYQAVPYNSNMVPGLALFLVDQFAPGDIIAPAIPNENLPPTLTNDGRTFTVTIDVENTESDFAYYEWQIRDQDNLQVGPLRKGVSQVLTWSEDGFDVRQRKVRVRAVDRTGAANPTSSMNKSDYTPNSALVSTS